MVYGFNRSAPRRRGQNLRTRRYDDILERQRGGMRFYKQIGGVHKFQRAYLKQTWAPTAGNSYYFGYSFSLSELPDYSELSNLFDAYRITGIKLTFMPRHTEAEIGTSGSSGLPTIAIVTDPNDANAPSSTAAVLQYPRAKLIQLSRPYSYYFKPRVATITTGTTNGTAEVKGSMWQNIDSPTVLHYGVKIATYFPSTTTVDVYAKFYLQCKNPR